MKYPKVRLLVVSFALTAGIAYPQARPSEEPAYKPNVFSGIAPKEDKSRLRDLKGLVKDDADNPVEGAVVKLKNEKTGKVVQFITKKDGSYLFYDLNMDIDYQLTAARDGFEDSKKTLTKYDSRKPATLNLQMGRKKTS